MYIRALLTAAGLLAGSAAHAQSLDLGFACEFQGAPLTSADVTTFGDQNQGRYTCSIDYTNNALADLANVVLTLNVRAPGPLGRLGEPLAR